MPTPLPSGSGVLPSLICVQRRDLRWKNRGTSSGGGRVVIFVRTHVRGVERGEDLEGSGERKRKEEEGVVKKGERDSFTLCTIW